MTRGGEGDGQRFGTCAALPCGGSVPTQGGTHEHDRPCAASCRQAVVAAEKSGRRCAGTHTQKTDAWRVAALRRRCRAWGGCELCRGLGGGWGWEWRTAASGVSEAPSENGSGAAPCACAPPPPPRQQQQAASSRSASAARLQQRPRVRLRAAAAGGLAWTTVCGPRVCRPQPRRTHITATGSAAHGVTAVSCSRSGVCCRPACAELCDRRLPRDVMHGCVCVL